MINKLLVIDYASLKEHQLMPEVETTSILSKASIVVNPTCNILMNKTIIINLPIEMPLERLLESNDIVSRFSTGYDIPVIPFNVPEERKEVTAEDMSCLILTKEVLQNINYAQFVHDHKFLVGTSETIEGDATLTGLEVLSNKVEQLKS